MKKIFTISLLLLITLSSCGTDNSANNTEKTSSIGETQSSVESNYLYVDVRTDEEWAEGHIDGAIHLTLADVEAGKTEILPKDKELRVYCRSGRRSAQAIEALKKQGFTNLVNAGGMKDIKDVTIVK
ncbi:hypothetical protein BLD25_04015 [Candidatus Gracilibacteria bacterium GN02-872]|nr:hypothetical protein BLD25_04015 [Candidatus Gracilibacteria bacterium GN02-872]